MPSAGSRAIFPKFASLLNRLQGLSSAETATGTTSGDFARKSERFQCPEPSRCRSRVTADDVRTAEALTRCVGLSDRIAYRQASALALPFEPATFDGAYMMHVGMNIEDKPKLFAELRRVLKTGGTFAIYDVMRVGDGELSFPLHWAATRATSFVATPAEYRQALQGADFAIVKERDRRDFARSFFRQATARAAGSAPISS